MERKNVKVTDKFLYIITLNFSLHQFDQGLSRISSALESKSKSHMAMHVSHAALPTWSKFHHYTDPPPPPPPNTKFKIQPNCGTSSSAAFSYIPLSITLTSPFPISGRRSTILVASQSCIPPSPIVTKCATTYFLLLLWCSSSHVSVFEVLNRILSAKGQHCVHNIPHSKWLTLLWSDKLYLSSSLGQRWRTFTSAT